MKFLIWHLIILLTIGEVFGQRKERIKLVEFSQSACDQSSDPDRIKPRIISLEHFSDTLLIEIGFAATCCSDYVPVIKYSSDTLYVNYTAKGEVCFCICCYSFNHTIKGIKSSKLTVKLHNEIIELSDEKYKTYPPTFAIVKGDTLNRKDKYGLKQGIWIEEMAIQKIESDTLPQKEYSLEQIIRSDQAVMFFRYKDDEIFTSGHLYLNVKLKDEYNAKTGVHQEFYRNGKIKRECYEKLGKLTNCRKWEANGEEVK